MGKLAHAASVRLPTDREVLAAYLGVALPPEHAEMSGSPPSPHLMLLLLF